MRAIILAAGMGRRISQKYPDKHKTLLPIPNGNNPSENIPLLIHSIQLLQSHHITDITVITGYLSESLEEELLAYNVEYRFNPFYYLVDSIGSLWFANNKLNNTDDTMIFNGDTYFDEELLHIVLHSKEQNNPVLFVDSSRKHTADVKTTYTDNYLEQYGKELSNPMAESLDVVILPKSIINIFRFQLKEILEERKHDIWWECALVDKRNNISVKVHDITGSVYWQEVDSQEDYLNLLDYCKRKNEK